MPKPLDQLSDLALEVYTLSMSARSCSSYEAGLRIASRLKVVADKLSKLAPAVMDAMTDGVLQKLMAGRFPEVKE